MSRYTDVSRIPPLRCRLRWAGSSPIRLRSGRITIKCLCGFTNQVKRTYIVVFVCITVKAVYLELISDCTTPVFIAAFDRFCARRDVPSDMYSDNATTFHGAQREVTAAWSKVTRDPNFLNWLATQGVRWRFTPPSAPHFGGLWDTCVCSVKHHIKRVIGSHTLTYDEYPAV